MQAQPIWLTKEDILYPPLRGRQQADVVVVGGGLCGLHTAYMLAKAGLRVVLLEADRLGKGASFLTTAKVTVQHGLIYSSLTARWGQEVAQGYALSQQKALNAMDSLVRELDIPCSWTWQEDSLVAVTPKEESLLQKEAEAARAAGLIVSLKPESGCPFPVRSELTISSQAMFDPVAYLSSLAEAFCALGGRIYEHSRVDAMDTESASTKSGSIRAPFMVIATHAPIINFPGWYFLRAAQRRSHVVALEEAPAFQGMYQHIAPGGFSLRNHGALTLLEGFQYRCGTQARMPHGEQLLHKAVELFPGSNPVAAWHSQDLYSADGLPFIGPYSRRTPSLFVATGFAKWGMTNSMAAALAIRARILGEPLMEFQIFDPARNFMRSIFPILSLEARILAARLTGFARHSAPRCSHMGCKLKYVPSTGTWDCPCHGSRFDGIGRIENGPAVKPARIRNKNRI